MKKIILFLIISCFIAQTNAQKLKESAVPVAVTAAFHKAHPAIKHIDWKGSGKNFETKYTDDKVEISHTYTAAGRLLESETEIVIASLPAPVMPYIEKHYKGSKVKDAAKMTSPDGVVTYGAGIKGFKLIFDAKGSFIKSVKE